ncbi:DUF1203 domain-containing protein [Chelatococcus sp. GW1]|uniref:DUF1203 domain-containing protein n=1 Tax=Chelatococcus sp. GW1 TaxID=1211115 RepID=UPI0002EF62F1|nr:DUF1203 domain-containing protein [Chelatococcus sp. GW1]
MAYRIRGLDPRLFDDLFRLDEASLARRGIVRRRVTASGTSPCRVSLPDAQPGEEVLLLAFAHHTEETSPYRASGPIFVRRAAEEAYDAVDAVPPILPARLISLRAYDAAGMIVDAGVVPGVEIESHIYRFLARPDIAHVDAHFAARGCFACRIERS